MRLVFLILLAISINGCRLKNTATSSEKDIINQPKDPLPESTATEKVKVIQPVRIDKFLKMQLEKANDDFTVCLSIVKNSSSIYSFGFYSCDYEKDGLIPIDKVVILHGKSSQEEGGYGGDVKNYKTPLMLNNAHVGTVYTFGKRIETGRTTIDLPHEDFPPVMIYLCDRTFSNEYRRCDISFEDGVAKIK